MNPLFNKLEKTHQSVLIVSPILWPGSEKRRNSDCCSIRAKWSTGQKALVMVLSPLLLSSSQTPASSSIISAWSTSICDGTPVSPPRPTVSSPHGIIWCKTSDSYLVLDWHKRQMTLVLHDSTACIQSWFVHYLIMENKCSSVVHLYRTKGSYGDEHVRSQYISRDCCNLSRPKQNWASFPDHFVQTNVFEKSDCAIAQRRQNAI